MRDLAIALAVAALILLAIRTFEDAPPRLAITDAAAPIVTEPRVNWTYCQPHPEPVPLLSREA